MVRLDDRAGNILTTIAVFAAVVAVVIAARATLVVFVLALLVAYLLEPVVARVEHLLPLPSHRRGTAIGVVYCVGALAIAAIGYTLVRLVGDQAWQADTALPRLAARFQWQGATGPADLVGAAVTRIGGAAAAAAGKIGWLLTVPVVAIFFLNDRTAMFNAAVDLFARHDNRRDATEAIQRIDRTIAEYARAEALLAGLSALFYGVSMALLGFPDPFALAVVGGALEFVPVVGWIIAAAAILESGWLAHAPWMWMAVLIAIWRVIQSFVISPRVMGERLQMEPVTVLFALMVGSQLGGLTGAILALPVVAVGRAVWDERTTRSGAASVDA